MNWPQTIDEKRKMAEYRILNIRIAMRNPYENAIFNHLQRTGFKWERQEIYGFRIFDFWCEQLGIDVEVDGTTHDPLKDAQSDKRYLNEEAIIVLRIRNQNGKDLDAALAQIRITTPWLERRKAAKLPPVPKVCFPSAYSSRLRILEKRKWRSRL